MDTISRSSSLLSDDHHHCHCRHQASLIYGMLLYILKFQHKVRKNQHLKARANAVIEEDLGGTLCAEISASAPIYKDIISDIIMIPSIGHHCHNHHTHDDMTGA